MLHFVNVTKILDYNAVNKKIFT